METRALGALEVSAVGFGAMVLSPGLYGAISNVQAERALLAALDCGSTFVDTSDGYGSDGHNERLIGRALGRRRDEIVIATKFGYRRPPGVKPHHFEVAYGTLAVNAEPQHVRGYAVASLERLGTDRIDLYSPHFPDPTVPIEETVGAIADLVVEGLVRHIGLSNVTPEQLERAAGAHRISAVQCEGSLWRALDPSLVAVADRHGIGIVAWSPLGAGFLTGELQAVGSDDIRAKFPRLTGANLALNNDRFEPLREIAADLSLTPSQLALAWLLHQHPHLVPIPGSRTAAHIVENAAAATTELSSAALARIDRALARFEPIGTDILTAPSRTQP